MWNYSWIYNKDMRPKVSIILPIYNAGNFLIDCLGSLIYQSFTDIEIIAILDCPTDGSDQICAEIAKTDSRIKIIRNEKNLHIGLSRNKGLEVATGEYVGFSDHDDYRELDMYERLYKQAVEDNLDMVLGVTVNEENGQRQVFNFPEELRPDDLRDFALTDLIGGGNFIVDYPYASNIHPNLYRKSIIDKYKICFVDTNHVVPEDRLFNIQFLLYSRRVGIETSPLYYHRILHSSESHHASYLSLEKRLSYIDKVYELLSDSHTLELYEPYFFIGAQKFIVAGLVNVLVVHKKWKIFRQTIDAIREKPYCKKMFNHYSLSFSQRLWVSRIERYVVNELSR